MDWFAPFRAHRASKPPAPEAPQVKPPADEQVAAAVEFICKTASLRPTRISELRRKCSKRFGLATSETAFTQLGERVRFFPAYVGSPRDIATMFANTELVRAKGLPPGVED